MSGEQRARGGGARAKEFNSVAHLVAERMVHHLNRLARKQTVK